MLNLKKLNEDGYESFRTNLESFYAHTYEIKQESARTYKDSYYSYLGLIPKVEEGDYVVPIVRKRVNGTQALIEQTFLEGGKPVILRPESGKITETVATAVNDYINKIIMNENDGYNAFSQAYTDALVFGGSFIKQFVDVKYYKAKGEIVEFMPTGYAVLTMEDGSYITLEEALEEYPETDVSGLETKVEKVNKSVTDELGEEHKIEKEVNLVKGKLDLLKEERKIGVKYIPFDEIYVDPYASTHDTADLSYLAHRMTKSRSEIYELFTSELTGKALEEMSAKIENLSAITSSVDSPTSMRKIHTSERMVDSGDDYASGVESESQRVSLLEHYIYSSNLYEGNKDRKPCDKVRKLYQVFTGANVKEILRITEVDIIPFAHGVALKLNTSFQGRSYYDLFHPDQCLQTSLYRAVQVNTDSAVFQRWTAVKGSYDKKSLLDARPGGVIETTAIGAIAPLNYHPLPNSTQYLMETLSNSSLDDEQRTIGKDLMDKASSNASATTTMLSSQNAEMGPKQVCRTIGETLHKQVIRNVYNLLRFENMEIPVDAEITEKAAEAMKKAGMKIPKETTFPGGILPEVASFTLDINTANDEARQAGQVANILNQVSMLKPEMLTEQEVYNSAVMQLKASGVEYPSLYLQDPSKKPQPTPEQVALQQKMAELQMKREEVEVGLLEVEFEKRIAESVQVIKESENYESDHNHKQKMEEHSIAIEYEKLKVGEKKDKADLAIDIAKLDQEDEKQVLTFLK